ncbi:50S ribosomal protein L32 [Candidatus Pinguicoccus supinus]|uniref:Large ribosomal subunit protein bL32 n=1 Tax=Candidatus Pinguicoccus supinus TaxID=2529394 RepID=A0A7T0FY19_9BACT|nr:50S ribosomal protein L32 [Candidatus Pinguicoccus supinus]
MGVPKRKQSKQRTRSRQNCHFTLNLKNIFKRVNNFKKLYS